MRRLIFASVVSLSLAGCAIQPRGPVVSHVVERFEGRHDGLIQREVWKDDAFTRGIFLLTDPSLTGVEITHSNITELGGCSHFKAGRAGITVDTNSAAIIGAGGTAAGNVLGAAVKAAAK